MVLPNVLRMINRPIVPAPRTLDDFKVALVNIAFPSIILLFGDIVGLPKLLARAQQHGKQLVVHLDLLDGIGKDKAGIKFLARLGVPAVITTKSHLGSAARDAGLMVIQRVFLMDSEALRQGINTLKKFTPDALEVLPAAVPAGVVQRLIRETGLPILAGGLMSTREEVHSALKTGVYAVSTSRPGLWRDFTPSSSPSA